jgi:hypothetical protein
VRLAILDVMTTPSFWRQANFDIKINDLVIQTCKVDESICLVDLP